MKLTKQQRDTLKYKFGGYCSYCGVVLGEHWQADHLIAIRRNWENYITADGEKATRFTDAINPEYDTLENLMPACTRCNKDKASIPLELWREMLENKIKLLNQDSRYKFAKSFGMVIETAQPVVFWFEKWQRWEQARQKPTI